MDPQHGHPRREPADAVVHRPCDAVERREVDLLRIEWP
jgi:hypothetical protein